MYWHFRSFRKKQIICFCCIYNYSEIRNLSINISEINNFSIAELNVLWTICNYLEIVNVSVSIELFKYKKERKMLQKILETQEC